MSEKVQLTRGQISHIENWTEKYSRAELVRTYINEPSRLEHIEDGVISMDLDTLIRALYIGYEVEGTPEEKIWDFYHTKAACDMHPHHAIQHVLNILNIKIEGVNA